MMKHVLVIHFSPLLQVFLLITVTLWGYLRDAWLQITEFDPDGEKLL